MSTLQEIFRQSTWANLRLIEACETLPDGQLDATPSGGTYGNIRSTLLHIVGAEERYVALLSEVDPGTRLSTQSFPGFDELKGRARRSGEALAWIAPEKGPEELVRRTFQGKDWDIKASVVLVQAINHSTEHRTQVKTILTELGIQPPELDGWTYGAAKEQIQPVS